MILPRDFPFAACVATGIEIKLDREYLPDHDDGYTKTDACSSLMTALPIASRARLHSFIHTSLDNTGGSTCRNLFLSRKIGQSNRALNTISLVLSLWFYQLETRQA